MVHKVPQYTGHLFPPTKIRLNNKAVNSFLDLKYAYAQIGLSISVYKRKFDGGF